jgi:single-stranded-DNA-specific exonuclease
VLAVAAHAGHREAALRERVGGFSLASYDALEHSPDLAEPYTHVVAIDPPDHPAMQEILERLPGHGWTHQAWGAPELAFAERILEWNYDLRPQLASVYRALRAAGSARGDACEALLRGEGPQSRSPRLAGRLIRVLVELRLVSMDPQEPLAWELPSAPARTELELSAAFRSYTRRLEDGRRFLTTSTMRAAA